MQGGVGLHGGESAGSVVPLLDAICNMLKNWMIVETLHFYVPEWLGMNVF